MYKVWWGLGILLVFWPSCSFAIPTNQTSHYDSRFISCHRENHNVSHVKYYKLNSVECRDMSFEKKLTATESGHLLGKVEIKSFYYSILSYKLTAFNVTFSNIKWQNLKFRFKQIGNDIKNACCEFFIMTNATKDELYYDCIWSNETYEGKPFFFEYEVNDESRVEYNKYSFNVPVAKNINEAFTSIENWEIFTYVEAKPTLNGLGSTTFMLHWQPLPKKFAVDVYNVSVLSNDTGLPCILHTESIKCTNISLCNYEYSKWHGSLQFAVQPICTRCSPHFSTKTLVFSIGNDKTKPLLLGILVATLAVPVLLFCLILARKRMIRKQPSPQETKPKVLIVYPSTFSFHSNVVFALAEYLENYCGVEPLVDEFHIISSKTRDPFKWCNESLKAADVVMVIPSPRCRAKGSSNSVYRKTNALLLRLLRESLADESSKKKFFVLMMSYASAKDVPREAENLRRFYFPRDIDNVLRFVHESWTLPRFLSPKLPGGKEDYKLYGQQVSCAIEEVWSLVSGDKDKPSVTTAGNDEVDSDHELLMDVRREAPSRRHDSNGNKPAKTAEDCFMDFPGTLERLNLSGEEEVEEEITIHANPSPHDSAALDVRELDL